VPDKVVKNVDLLVPSDRRLLTAGPNPRRAAPGFAPTAVIGGPPPSTAAAGNPRSPPRRVTFQASDTQSQVCPKAVPCDPHSEQAAHPGQKEQYLNNIQTLDLIRFVNLFYFNCRKCYPLNLLQLNS